MRKRLVSLLLAALIVLAAVPISSATETVPCMTVDSSLIIIGDSNTVFLKKNNPDIQPARIYARVNATIAECAENWSRYHADGYDKGIYQLISELDGDSFDTVVINVGTNNAGTPSSTYKDYYREVVTNFYTKNPDAVIYLCKILPINPAHYSGDYPDVFTVTNINRINACVEEVQQEFAAQGYDARIMDLYTPFSNAYGVLDSAYDNGGGIHLSVSGYKYLTKVVQSALAAGDPDANHSWDEGTVLTPPTCAEAGKGHFTCTVCGLEKDAAIPATGEHAWDEGTVEQEATCVKDGLCRLRCTVCGTEKEEVIPATGVHKWETTVIQAATCIESGLHKLSCPDCGAEKEEVVPPTGVHAWNAGTVVQMPSCTETGACSWVCQVCGTEMSATIPALGHVWKLTELLTEGETFHDSTGRYDCARCQQSKEAPLCAAEVFDDMPAEDHWAHAAIDWAYFNGLTSGTSATTFSPDAVLTRGQVVTFLYAFCGRPEAEADNPFEDVTEDDYFFLPVLWAVEKEVTGGTTATTFSPNASCTRAQIVTFLWAAAGRPEPENTECVFEDVSETDYFLKAVLWAAENGITSGVDATHFGSEISCTRAQMVTFLKAASAVMSEEEPEEPQPEEPDPNDPTDPEEPEPEEPEPEEP